MNQGDCMVKNTKLKDVTKEDLLVELDNIIKAHNLTTITQREYFSLSKFSDFILKKLGINFNSLKEELGIVSNVRGKKARTLTIEDIDIDSTSSISFENPIKKEYTGKIVSCLKSGRHCEGDFRQSNLFHRVCSACAKENMQVSEASSIYW